jgi:hypothetical protein
LASDNFLSVIYPARESVASAQFGLNLQFGRILEAEPIRASGVVNPYNDQSYNPKKIKKTKRKRRKINQKRKKRPRAN